MLSGPLPRALLRHLVCLSMKRKGSPVIPRDGKTAGKNPLIAIRKVQEKVPAAVPASVPVALKRTSGSQRPTQASPTSCQPIMDTTFTTMSITTTMVIITTIIIVNTLANLVILLTTTIITITIISIMKKNMIIGNQA